MQRITILGWMGYWGVLMHSLQKIRTPFFRIDIDFAGFVAIMHISSLEGIGEYFQSDANFGIVICAQCLTRFGRHEHRIFFETTPKFLGLGTR